MKKLQQCLRNQKGFTFVEIMIVVVIIGFLTSVVVPQIIGRVGKAKQVTAQNQINNLELALDQYYLDCGRYPTTEQGLQALVKKPTISPIPKGWDGPYFKKDIPKDPWGNDYIYKYPGEHNPDSYDLYSLGRDGQEGGTGEDADITNWSNLEE
ncbi:type II secretion system protein GspG [Anoxybacter fermentans]|uniref:Type II secretion system core protein G n=1 Tax=Anoxybacter fermentans TaxID=1323375 RepID=A0A3Q9HPL8_9FIRM|nr:type II secretion system major pseudopilin GspG [Anoxybacter fermentans]AZR72565.1 type II secretion system protein GspG [Anoxybacter fermentans]